MRSWTEVAPCEPRLCLSCPLGRRRIPCCGPNGPGPDEASALDSADIRKRFRLSEGEGGSNPHRLLGHGPVEAFARNIEKLNRESPLGGGGVKSLGRFAQVPHVLSRADFFSAPCRFDSIKLNQRIQKRRTFKGLLPSAFARLGIYFPPSPRTTVRRKSPRISGWGGAS